MDKDIIIDVLSSLLKTQISTFFPCFYRDIELLKKNKDQQVVVFTFFFDEYYF